MYMVDMGRTFLRLLAVAGLGLTSMVATAAPKPDLSGVWLSWDGQDDTPDNAINNSPASLFDARGTAAPGGEPQLKEPYLTEYRALKAKQEQQDESGKPIFDSETQCRPDGMPKMMRAFLPIQIVQTPSMILVLTEELMQIRRIYINELAPPLAELTASYSGYSVGRWQQGTLVVETIAVRPEARFLDLPHSDKMKITERLKRISAGVLENQVTIEDPEVLVRPYVFTWRYKKEHDYKLMEYICDNNRYQSDNEGNSVIRFSEPPASR